MMAADAIGEPLFLDTSLIIAATVEAHPGHRASTAFIDARVAGCLRLVQQFSVLGKQIHDCNIVATMMAHGVRHLATRNAADFKRYGALLSVEAVTD